MTPSKIFFYFCLAFISGISLRSFLIFSQVLFLGFCIAGLILISVFWKYKKPAMFGFCILFSALGIWRYNALEAKQNPFELAQFSEKKVLARGVIVEEPSLKENTTQIVLKVDFIHGGEFFYKKKFKVLVTQNHYPEYEYGDRVELIGELKIPSSFEGFN